MHQLAMYRRTLIGLAAATLLGILFTGCDSFLEKSPQGEITSENFWRSADDAQRGLNAVYDYTQARSFPAGTGVCVVKMLVGISA